MQHVTSFTMFDSYHVALFTLQTRDFEKIQDGPQCVKWCIIVVEIKVCFCVSIIYTDHLCLLLLFPHCDV